MIISSLIKCNIKVNVIIICCGGYKNMAPIMSNFNKLKCVFMHGRYARCDVNYSLVKRFSTTTSSLYLLRNFQNIKSLWLAQNGKFLELEDDDCVDNLILPNLKELLVCGGYNFVLDDILRISPNLETIRLSNKDLCDIETSVQERRVSTIVSLAGIIGPINFDGKQIYCVYQISGVIRNVLYNKIVTKYPNVKHVKVFDHTGQPANDILEIIKEVTQEYPQIDNLRDNNLYGILMYAYKIVCIHSIMCYDIDRTIIPQILKM